MPQFTDLPYDCIGVILQYLDDFRALCRMAQMNELCHELVQDDDLWSIMLSLHFPNVFCARSVDVFSPEYQNIVKREFCKRRFDAMVSLFKAEDDRDGSHCALLRRASDLSFSKGGCFGEKGAQKLSPILKDNASLQTLDLSNQLIRDGGFTTIANSLATCSSLVSLSLMNNRLSDAGPFSDAIQCMTHLRRLDVRKNQLQQRAVRALCIQAAHYEMLLLDDNPVGTEGATRLLTAFAELQERKDVKPTLAHLSLQRVGLTSDCGEALVRFVSSAGKRRQTMSDDVKRESEASKKNEAAAAVSPLGASQPKRPLKRRPPRITLTLDLTSSEPDNPTHNKMAKKLIDEVERVVQAAAPPNTLIVNLPPPDKGGCCLC